MREKRSFLSSTRFVLLLCKVCQILRLLHSSLLSSLTPLYGALPLAGPVNRVLNVIVTLLRLSIAQILHLVVVRHGASTGVLETLMFMGFGLTQYFYFSNYNDANGAIIELIYIFQSLLSKSILVFFVYSVVLV